MNAVRTHLVAAALCCVLALTALAQVAVPALTGRVVDQTSTLSSDATARITQKLKDLQTRKGSQIAVLLVPSVQPETIEQFSLRVAEAWKIGRKKIDDGALLVIAKADRKLRIEVGYGLEGALNDVTAKRIIDEIITPKFKAGDFDGGVEAGVDRMIGVIDGEPLPVPQPQHDWQSSIDPDAVFPIVFGVFVLNTVMNAMLGRIPASLISGVATGAGVFYLLQSLIAALIGGILGFFVAAIINLMSWSSGRGGGHHIGSSGGSWSGGSSSSDWSSSSGSSDSGFSGGGGDFGGGGASGSW